MGDQLVVGAILDPFYLRVKIAFIAGLILSCPVWLYQLWAFVAPGLYAREKRWTYLFLGTAVPLFAGGAAFGYLVMPRGLRYLLGLTPSGALNLPSVDTYLSYALLLLAGPCAVLVEIAEVIVWANDRRRARLHPDPYASLADDELSSLELIKEEGPLDSRRPSSSARSTVSFPPETVEFSVSHSSEKSVPFVRRESENRTRGVTAVAHADLTIG